MNPSSDMCEVITTLKHKNRQAKCDNQKYVGRTMTLEIQRLGPRILKSDWLFPRQYLPIIGPVRVSLPVQSIHFVFHVAVI